MNTLDALPVEPLMVACYLLPPLMVAAIIRLMRS